MPAWIAPCGQDAVTFQPSGDLLAACALQILPEDALDDLRLDRINDQMPLLVLVIAEEVSGILPYFAPFSSFDLSHHGLLKIY